MFETTFVPGSAKFQKFVQDLLLHQRASIDATAHDIDTMAVTSRNLLLGLAALALAFGAVCAWLLTISIVHPLRTAVSVARRVADGDLTAQIDAMPKMKPGNCCWR